MSLPWPVVAVSCFPNVHTTPGRGRGGLQRFTGTMVDERWSFTAARAIQTGCASLVIRLHLRRRTNHRRVHPRLCCGQRTVVEHWVAQRFSLYCPLLWPEALGPFSHFPMLLLLPYLGTVPRAGTVEAAITSWHAHQLHWFPGRRGLADALLHQGPNHCSMGSGCKPAGPSVCSVAVILTLYHHRALILGDAFRLPYSAARLGQSRCGSDTIGMLPMNMVEW